jgi:UPF0755 protein
MLKSVRAVVFGLVVFSVAFSCLTYFAYSAFYHSGELKNARLVIIPKGFGLSDIAKYLEKNGIIKNRYVLILGAKFLRVSTQLKAGEYAFPARVPPSKILELLSAGRTLIRQVTIPEGLTSAQIVRLLENEKNLSGVIAKTPKEGSLFPETYNYSFGDTRVTILARMQKKMEINLREAWSKRDRTIPIKNVYDALKLASIIEKETAKREERFLIASVFANRLKKKMRLQSDPTVTYGRSRSDLSRPISRADLKRKTPHNTYIVRGLPKTPICNPGAASIEAALNPARTDFFYFVAKGSGLHSFSKTLVEHNKNVRKWRSMRQKLK